MNKAFVKEPEPEEPRCPHSSGCGGRGTPVAHCTLAAHLPPEKAQAFGESAYYCPHADCDIAYFDAWGTTARVEELRSTAYPKSPGAPVCSCLGVTAEDIRGEAVAGRKERVRELLAHAEGPEARCATQSPSGGSCAAAVRQLFLQHFSG